MIKSNTNNNLITALYCRLSQEDMRSGESLSIENQRLMLTEYADKNGFKNAKLYIDDGFSGTDNTRPAYVEMLEDVKNGLVGTVIVKDQSRLGRDHLETDRLMELIFPAYDVRFIAITDGVDSANGFNEMSGIRNLFNDMYARDTSKKIRAVQRAKGERGERVGTCIPYGYLKDPNDPKKIIPDPEAAAVVKRIFEMYASGKGAVKICDVLTQEKVLSPSEYLFRKTGRRTANADPDKPFHWVQSTVRDMLSNQIYCGDTVNFKTYSKSYKLEKKLKNKPENMLIFKDTHEAIIDRKTFELVQKHFAGRKRPDKQGEMDKYAGYLYCGECGSRLYLHRSKSMKASQNNFMCGGYQTRSTECTSHYIREIELDRIVLTELQNMIAYAKDNSEQFYKAAMQNGEQEAKKQMKAAEKEKADLTARISQLDSIINVLFEDRAVGRITPERFEQIYSNYEKEQAEIKTKLAVLEEKQNSFDIKDRCVRQFIENAKRLVNITKLTPELLRTFIKRIEVFEKEQKYSRTCGNKIVIQFNLNADQSEKCDGILESGAEEPFAS